MDEFLKHIIRQAIEDAGGDDRTYFHIEIHALF
jgi:hypothetical protein